MDCNATYIRQTKRHLEIRVKEHQRDIRKPSCNYSLVSKHRLSYDHKFNWSKIINLIGHLTILHREKHRRKRKTVEMFYKKSLTIYQFIKRYR